MSYTKEEYLAKRREKIEKIALSYDFAFSDNIKTKVEPIKYNDEENDDKKELKQETEYIYEVKKNDFFTTRSTDQEHDKPYKFCNEYVEFNIPEGYEIIESDREDFTLKIDNSEKEATIAVDVYEGEMKNKSFNDILKESEELWGSQNLITNDILLLNGRKVVLSEAIENKNSMNIFSVYYVIPQYGRGFEFRVMAVKFSKSILTSKVTDDIKRDIEVILNSFNVKNNEKFSDLKEITQFFEFSVPKGYLHLTNTDKTALIVKDKTIIFVMGGEKLSFELIFEDPDEFFSRKVKNKEFLFVDAELILKFESEKYDEDENITYNYTNFFIDRPRFTYLIEVREPLNEKSSPQVLENDIYTILSAFKGM